MNIFPLIAAGTVALAVTTSGAFAAGSETPTKPTKSETTQDCEKGFVWDKKKEECVKIEASIMPDDEIYKNARELAYDGQYDNALKLLAMADNPRDPRILTYQGYANRKAGRVAKGMEYYQQALNIDPTFVLARSYMGQAFVQTGQIDAAEEELVQIAALSGTNNWPYQSLARAIRGDITTDY